VAAALFYGYLGGWALTTALVAFLGSRLQDKRQPAPHPNLLAVAAGAAWPLLVVALAEAGAVALTHEVVRDDEPHLSVVA